MAFGVEMGDGKWGGQGKVLACGWRICGFAFLSDLFNMNINISVDKNQYHS